MIYISEKEAYLLLEALDILDYDYDEEHQEIKAMEYLQSKLRKHISKLEKKKGEQNEKK